VAPVLFAPLSISGKLILPDQPGLGIALQLHKANMERPNVRIAEKTIVVTEPVLCLERLAHRGPAA
jgi:hypothetical protein